MSKNVEILHQAAAKQWFVPSNAPATFVGSSDSSTSVGLLPHDEIMKLTQRLFLRGNENNSPRVVSFSGAADEDRSCRISARAGESLASQVETSVCLVDANLSSPRLQDYFGLGSRHGLGDALSSESPIRNFANQMWGGNLWVITSGLVRTDCYRQMERFRARFAELRREFAYILIIAPSIVREPESTLIGQLADGVILIVEANNTRREAIRRAKERLVSAKVELLGAVLDQRTFPVPEFLYRKL